MSKQCRLQLFGLKSNITETEESPRFKLLWAFGDGREDSDTDSRRRRSLFYGLLSSMNLGILTALLDSEYPEIHIYPLVSLRRTYGPNHK